MYTVLTNSSCQVFLLSERIVSYKYGTCILIRLTYKRLTSWLSFVVSSVSLSLSHWYPGSGVVLDCIGS